MPTTARAHFDDDIARAAAILAHARSIEPTNVPLATDLARSAIAFAVGALDAYLCDAFTDTLARCLRHCRTNSAPVPSGYAKLMLPVGPLVTAYAVRQNWGLRMAARAYMERDNLLQLSRLKDLFNPALPSGQKLWTDLAPAYVSLNRKRMTYYSLAEWGALTGPARGSAPKKVSECLLRRMGSIVQRRHDIVHNCDRPKYACQALTTGMAGGMLTDITSFIRILDDHIHAHRLY